MKQTPKRTAIKAEKEQHAKHRLIAEIVYGDELVYHRVVPVMYGRFTA